MLFLLPVTVLMPQLLGRDRHDGAHQPAREFSEERRAVRRGAYDADACAAVPMSLHLMLDFSL